MRVPLQIFNPPGQIRLNEDDTAVDSPDNEDSDAGDLPHYGNRSRANISQRDDSEDEERLDKQPPSKKQHKADQSKKPTKSINSPQKSTEEDIFDASDVDGDDDDGFRADDNERNGFGANAWRA